MGRYADLIAVDGDPLSNIRELESVDAVVKGGVLVKGEWRIAVMTPLAL